MSDLTIATLRQQLDALESGQISSLELVDAQLKRTEHLNGALNAFISIDRDGAMAAAAAADQARAMGQRAPLLGVPIAHKDLFCTQGLRTSCGSKMLDNFIAPYNATVVENLTEAGAVSLGKTNMDEFAMGSSNENSYYGPAVNPWGERRVPGGSSGGSAAAVAASMVAAATATDTGGSIRQPAAFTGTSGIKPTYGRCSRFGMVAYASSLDQAGPIAQTAEDLALMLSTMVSHDPKDSTSAHEGPEDFTRLLNNDVQGLRIGVPEQFFSQQLDDQVAQATRDALATLEQRGAVLVPVELPNLAHSLAAYYVIAPAEASANLSRFDGVRYGHRCDHPANLQDLYRRSRSEGFGLEVQRRILVGTYALSASFFDAYYVKAQQIRRLIKNDFMRAFETVDVIAGPTTPTPAFKIGEKSDDPADMYLQDVYTISANLAGLPGLSIPCGLVDGLPVGLQILGQHFDEARMLQLAHQYQLNTDWHQQRAPMLTEGAA
ncbi:Asp-tRNA(Asn)/Glu-tRNA(Gln) amidotransferase subunit GatA [Litorivicinus lipolyticus]|uniref:Glutamyl-tRNA(Gln) amidotransferase subunit A n=1 Tax=Litorivicinus lipolyticus TaxID=418701 RepID=A0A5Q2QG83_9GAMM|nr:Asp-tRNA(Asn)/Glu-tRNA(Gln) amidotransferase subunit GatA [Litorivicinus lipolyticus]QGG80997.1 Asp-tRNA(Asn)/Glu-tRNA(Gln) amidotransferase subunit GatA [Litorivicinus lipolyticus]